MSGMKAFTFETKVPHIYFGEGVSLKTGKIAGDYDIKKAIVVYDKGIKAAGVVDPILASLKEAGIEYVEFSEVVPDPLYTDVDKGGALARAEQVDGVIGIGGGSSIDTAKGIHVLLGNPESESILPFCFGIGKGLQYRVCKLPIICIPTTSGTGSEVSDGMVLTDPVPNKKGGRGGQMSMVPMVSIIDPKLDTGLPLGQTACTGIDALTHAIEPYLLGSMAGARRPINPWTDMMALEAVELIFGNLPAVMDDPKNAEKRTPIKYACMLAGIAMSSSALSMGHTMSYSICLKWHLPHGLGCALGLVPSIRQADKMVPGEAMTARLRALAAAAGLDVPADAPREQVVDRLCAAVEALLDRVGIPKLGEYGTIEDDLEYLVADTVAGSRLEGVTEEDYRAHYIYLFNR